MRRLLLDENIPHGLRVGLSAYWVETAYQRGWSGLANGKLLTASEAEGFDVIITADRSIRYQQNLTGRKIALIVLTTSHWGTIRAHLPSYVVIESTQSGAYVTVKLPRPPKRRRPYPAP